MTTFSRRHFNSILLTGLAGSMVAPARLLARAPEPVAATFFEWKAAAGSAQVAVGRGGNALLVTSGKESLLIDCKNPGLGATLRREAEAFGARLRTLVNTHHHGDHTGGNSAFAKDMPVIAHANAKARIEAQTQEMLGRAERTLKGLQEGDKPAPQSVIDEVKAFIDTIASIKASDFAPTRLIDQRMEADKFNGLEVQYHHIGAGHTDNDLVVFFPSLNLIHMGDLLFHRNYPFIDLTAGATTIGWQNSLREAIKLCDGKTVVVPGHGDLTDVTGLTMQIEFFDKIRDVVRHAKDVESMTKEEVMALKPGAFEGYGLEQIRPRTLGAIFDELSKP